MPTDFTNAIIGGLLIGVSASLLFFLNGKIAGISGIFNRAIYDHKNTELWRWCFVIGLIIGGALAHQLLNISIPDNQKSILLAAAAGLLVGIGTRIGNGCTSGHGVCGIGRRSIRSLIATLVFMATGIITIFIGRHLL